MRLAPFARMLVLSTTALVGCDRGGEANQAEDPPPPPAKERLVRADDETLAQFGKRVYDRMGCDACHGTHESTSGVEGVGPGLSGIAGTQRPIQGKDPKIADAAYLRRAILTPNDELLEGYNAVAPNYEGVMTDEETEALVALIQCGGAKRPPELDCSGL